METMQQSQLLQLHVQQGVQEITQERSHLYRYLPLQVHCDNMDRNIGVVSILLLIHLTQFWDKIVTPWMIHPLIQWDRMHHLLLILGMKHLDTKPIHHLVDLQEWDSFELIVNTSQVFPACSVVRGCTSICTLKQKLLLKRFWSILYTLEPDHIRNEGPKLSVH